MPSRLSREFFAREADAVARELIGCTLVRVLSGTRIAGRIVETEAYMGADDQASHARNNRRTPRTEPMFGPPGLSYIYFTYGMHHCMNVSCKAINDPAAVLIRALEPREGLDHMRKLRGPAHKDRDLCRGPARLCQALAIGPTLNAINTLTSDTLWFERGGTGLRSVQGSAGLRPARTSPVPVIATSPRIGLGDKADEGGWTLRPLRFFIAGSPFVSGPSKPK